jgi:threonine dehydrogenase-like Zn-dependent dehydrogenase
MKAVLLDVPRSAAVTIAVRPRPVPAAGEVLLRVELCGLCGSDFSACRFDGDGRPRYSGPLALPVVLGHEASATVEAVGDGVERVRLGQLVAVESVVSCWRCDTCLAGLPAQCERAELVGLSRDGALAEHVVVPERACFALDSLLAAGRSRAEAAVAGALLEPLGVAYSALFLVPRPLVAGEALVVYGLGALGMLVGRLARLAGASAIVGVDREEDKVAAATAHGFDVALRADLGLDDPSDLAAEIRRRLGRVGAELQVEVSGCPDGALPVAERLLAAGGRVVLLSRSRRPTPAAMDPWVSAAGSLVGLRGRVDGRAYGRLLALFAGGRLVARDLVARFVGIDEVPAILLDDRPQPPGKTIAVVGGEAPW